MNDKTANEAGSRHMGRSIWALLAGFVVGVVLSLGTDVAMQAIGVFPTLGHRMGDRPLLLATAYRSLYTVFSSYLTARLAPNRPMQHALLSGAIALVLNLVGAVVTWNRDLGPHWYPIALTLLAMPLAWLGGKIRTMQLHETPAD